jgi:hypothetical protein
MSKFELIDDYLAGRLDEGRQKELEQEINSDPQLRAEVNIQKQIIGGVQKARAAELKAMLNSVPIATGGSAAVTAGKIAAVVITAGIIGSAVYFGLKDEVPAQQEEKQNIEQPQDQVSGDSANLQEADPSPEQSVPKVEEPRETATARQPVEEERKVTQPVTPKIEVVDPMEELEEETTEPPPTSQFPKGSINLSSIEVETNAGDKKHDFHYQFHTGKLILFGPFDQSLYEIIEINGDVHSIFLYYNKNYYLLNQAIIEITPLKAITDKELISKLNDYRNR